MQLYKIHYIDRVWLKTENWHTLLTTNIVHAVSLSRPSLLMGVKMVVIIVLAMSVLWEDLVCKMVAIPNDCFMLRGALNVRFTTLLFHIGPYFRSYWRYPSSKKL